MHISKHQLVFIHGGETFDTYEDFLEALQSWEFDPKKAEEKRWKHSLTEQLGEEWEVIAPLMPNKYDAKYRAWKIWFEKVIPLLRDDVVLVGHSLGGLFLAKYLSEETFRTHIKALFLVAAPFDTKDSEHSLADFILPKSLSRLEEQVGVTMLYHSKDDQVVPFSAFEKYQQALSKAETRIFKDKGHFMQEEFPELITEVKALFS